MDIEHHNQKLQLDGALHLCPLDDPKEILDLGTGSEPTPRYHFPG